jgi:hypothetical protein
MLKSLLIASLSLAACAPTTHNNTTPIYAGAARAPAAKSRGIAMRGKVPRGKRVEYVVAVQIDRQGKRRRIRVRPAADGSYAMQLPPGHRYAMAYEDRGRLVGNVSFPSAHGKPSTTINVSQTVVMNQQYIDLGEPTYVGGVFVAAADPELYLDSDGDGVVDMQDGDDDGDGVDDMQDPDDNDDNIIADASMFDGDFEDVDSAAYDDGDDAGGSEPVGGSANDDGDDDSE